MVGPKFVAHSRSQRRTPIRVFLLCASLVLLPHPANAQEETAPNLPLPSASGGAGVRPELQALLEDVETQLRAATNAGNQDDIDRLIDLRGRLQVIQLQVELEELQNENADLVAQDANGETATGAASPEASEMQDEVQSLNDMQADTVRKLNDIAEQHAFLLEQLGQVMPDMPGIGKQVAAAATVDGQVIARLREIQVLNAKFQKLADQQKQIGEVLAVVSEEHANLLEALGVPEPAHPGTTYTVQEGDSLSSIAQTAYGSPNRWSEIVQANPSLRDPSVLYVGTILTIP